MQSCQLLGNAFLLQRLFSAQHEGEVEEEEDEEVEEEEEEDEGKVVYFIQGYDKCMLSMMAFYLHYLKNMIELNYILLRYRWWI